ncbi:SSI family serine proteinase inhibitor [Saccharopolyspora griseoalba]|uniref:SSI family serine proteinase inhibitor n=1 Tax=Saccharopolyspora griseoalba TaxID=1431848 RepID=A0ABW2LEU0_9PSEU
MDSPRLVGTALLAAAMAAGALAPAATAADQQRAHLGVVNLTISGHDAKDLRTAMLSCGPDAGTHPDPGAACEAITDVEGDFHAIDGGNGLCPLIYDPVTVRATGVYDGRAVDYVDTFSNACIAASRTAGVFAF